MPSRSGSQVRPSRARRRANPSSRRTRSGGTVIGETRAGPTGSFSFSNLAAGTYTVVAGNDRNGNGALGDAGEFYGTTTLEVSYDGDTGGITVPVAPQ